MPASLSFHVSIWFRCSWFSMLFLPGMTGIIILLPINSNSINYRNFISEWPDMAVVLSVLQLSMMASPHNAYSDSVLRCSSSIVADLISSAVIAQSGMSMHDSYGIYSHVYYQDFCFSTRISSFLFVSWLCLDSHIWLWTAVVQGLYSILMLLLLDTYLCSL